MSEHVEFNLRRWHRGGRPEELEAVAHDDDVEQLPERLDPPDLVGRRVCMLPLDDHRWAVEQSAIHL